MDVCMTKDMFTIRHTTKHNIFCVSCQDFGPNLVSKVRILRRKKINGHPESLISCILFRKLFLAEFMVTITVVLIHLLFIVHKGFEDMLMFS